MAKKYLLYIHNDRLFDKELFKSELVNKLLRNHWEQHEPGDYLAPIEQIEELKDDFLPERKDKPKLIKEDDMWAGPLMRNPKKGKL